MGKSNYTYIGEYNVKPLIQILNNLSDDTWYEWTHKQTTYDVHKHTLSIPLLLDETYGKDHSEKGIKSTHYNKFQNEINEIEVILNKFYGAGEIIRAELALLKANHSVGSHIDFGESLTHNQRIHLPIISNTKNIFIVGGESRHLEVGNLYEIDNTSEHSVQNNSTKDRIHLIIDYKQKPNSII